MHLLSSTANVYPGHENPLEMSQLYTVSYTCDFDLNMFPFDTQVKEKDTNHLHFVLKKKKKKSLRCLIGIS